MKGLIVLYGEEDPEKVLKEAIQFDYVILFHAIDQELFSDIPQLKFASMLSKTEEMIDELEVELRKKGILVKVESKWGPLGEEVKNAIKLWEPDRVLAFKSDSDIGKKASEILGKIKGLLLV